MNEFLASTEIVDWREPNVSALAKKLAEGSKSVEETAKRCFHWVRDEVEHSVDFRRKTVTCWASEVHAERTGYCYAKSHLLAALLRANSIPTGFCYQRLSLSGSGPPFALHGLNAILLSKDDWYRVDARGNTSDIKSSFSPPIEKLAFSTDHAGEMDLPEIYSDPLPIIIELLQSYQTVEEVQAHLPDIPIK